MSLTESEYEFVIVGSGAGGGPLAANLAAAGHRVLLLEAGDDHSCVYYQAPIFHAQASEDEDMRWDYFVRHYRDDHAQAEDPKHTPDRGGVLYPRGGTLGGSTAISAMITVCPHNSDWDRIATTVGDDSWRAERMRLCSNESSGGGTRRHPERTLRRTIPHVTATAGGWEPRVPTLRPAAVNPTSSTSSTPWTRHPASTNRPTKTGGNPRKIPTTGGSSSPEEPG